MTTSPKLAIQSRHIYRTPARGLSLVELMVAVVLGMFVTLAIISSFIAQSQTMRTTQGLGERVDGLRAAAEVLARAVREHGYDPCFTSDPGTSSALSVEAPQYDTDSVSPKWLTTFRYEPVTTSNSSATVSVASVSGNTITFSGPHGLVPGDRVSICTTLPTTSSLSLKATVQSVSGSTVTFSQPLGLENVTTNAIQVAKRVNETWTIRAIAPPPEEDKCKRYPYQSLYKDNTEVVTDIDELKARFLPNRPNQIQITLTTFGVCDQQGERRFVIDVAMRNAGGI